MTTQEFISQFKVGDKVVGVGWLPETYVIITYISGDDFFVARDGETREHYYLINFGWKPYTEPKPKVRKGFWRVFYRGNNHIMFFITHHQRTLNEIYKEYSVLNNGMNVIIIDELFTEFDEWVEE